MIGRVLAACEEDGAREQILEPHQRADPFVQRMLVANHEACRSVTPSFCRKRAAATAAPSSARLAGPRCELAIAPIEPCNLRRERAARSGIVDHVVGLRETLRARKPRRH